MNRQLFTIWPGVCFAVLCVSALPAGFPNTINLLAFGIGPDGTAYAGGFNAPSLGFVGDPNPYRIDKATGQLTLIGDTGVEMLMDYYAPEAVSLPPSEPAMDKTALRDHLAWLFDNYTTHHEWNAVEFRLAEDLLVERGEYARRYVPKAGNEPLPDETGKHVVVYTRVDNEWKILWEIWSPDE